MYQLCYTDAKSKNSHNDHQSSLLTLNLIGREQKKGSEERDENAVDFTQELPRSRNLMQSKHTKTSNDSAIFVQLLETYRVQYF